MDELELREERNAKDDDWNELLNRTRTKGILFYYYKHMKLIYKVITVHFYTKYITNRECHGFTNPHGLQSRVVTGAGAGWQIVTPQKPAPVAQV